MLALVIFSIAWESNDWSGDDVRSKRFAKLMRKCAKTITIFNVLVYFIGSTYLVVESFRQLFALPPDLFTLPSWGNYWPHFA